MKIVTSFLKDEIGFILYAQDILAIGPIRRNAWPPFGSWKALQIPVDLTES